MTTDDKIEILERICGSVYHKFLSIGTYRVWIGEFNPTGYCPTYPIPGFASYFTTDGDDKDATVNKAYQKLNDALYRLCNNEAPY